MNSVTCDVAPPTLSQITVANRCRFRRSHTAGEKSPARLAGEFGLRGALLGHQLSGFHLVFPGSLRRQPTTPVLSLYTM